MLGNWWDLVAVIIFSLVIFYYAVSLAMDSEKVAKAVEIEEKAIAAEDDKLNLPG